MNGARRTPAGRARAESDRQLTAEEAAAYLSAPITPEERDEVIALVRWFCRRYPTGAERLAYVRRAYRRWSARTSSTIQPNRED